MNWLLWREYRVNRPIVITGAVLLVLPYVIVLIALGWRAPQQFEHRPGQREAYAAEMLVDEAIFSLMLSQVTLALLGGNAIAGERADRSAEFIAYLPVSRFRLLASKWTFQFSALAMIWGINGLVIWIPAEFYPTRIDLSEHASGLGYLAITGLVIYGVAWCISSFPFSPAFAVFGSLVTPLLIWTGILFFAWAFDDRSIVKNLGTLYRNICVPLGIAGFLTGTWYYLLTRATNSSL